MNGLAVFSVWTSMGGVCLLALYLIVVDFLDLREIIGEDDDE